jgi:hypothetical protein
LALIRDSGTKAFPGSSALMGPEAVAHQPDDLCPLLGHCRVGGAKLGGEFLHGAPGHVDLLDDLAHLLRECRDGGAEVLHAFVVQDRNQAAARVAGFTGTIRSVLAGGTVRENADGTADVLIGGNALVSGTSTRTLAPGGQATMNGPWTAVQVEWADRQGVPAGLDGGKLAGAVSLLARHP